MTTLKTMTTHAAFPMAAGLVLFLTAGPASPAERTIRFDVDNRSGDRILEVYVTPSRSPRWGANLLAQGALQRGLSIALSFQGDCGLYDVRLVAPGGKEYMEDEVSFCGENDVLTVEERELTKARRSEKK